MHKIHVDEGCKTCFFCFPYCQIWVSGFVYIMAGKCLHHGRCIAPWSHDAYPENMWTLQNWVLFICIWVFPKIGVPYNSTMDGLYWKPYVNGRFGGTTTTIFGNTHMFWGGFLIHDFWFSNSYYWFDCLLPCESVPRRTLLAHHPRQPCLPSDLW